MRKALLVVGICFFSLLLAFIIRVRIGVGVVDSARIMYLSSNKMFLSQDECESNAFVSNRMNEIYENLDDYDIFIYGEEHGYGYSSQFDLALFKYLHEHYGITQYAEELSATDAKLADLFINNEYNDRTLLDSIMISIKSSIPQRYTLDYYSKWLSLREYNMSLDSISRIHVVGLLSDDYVNGVEEISRDESMHSEFMALYSKSHGKTYCSVGQMHAMRDSLDVGEKYLPFAGLLENEALKVHSTVMIPASSKSYWPGGTYHYDSEDGPLCYTRGIRNLKKAASKGGLTVFALDREESPYDTSDDLLHFSSLFGMYGVVKPVPGHHVTDYFQSVLLVYGAKPPVQIIE